MNLYEVNDNLSNFLNGDEITSELIWAWGADEARRLYADLYEHILDVTIRPFSDADRILSNGGVLLMDDDEVRLIAQVTRIVPIEDSWRPAYRDTPLRERRLAVMRLAGWKEEDEPGPCDACGLYSMGLTTFCDACYVCGFCGCGCGDDDSGE